MSFKLFVYYCALCGGWAAFLAWAVMELANVAALRSVAWQAALRGGALGLLVAAAVGLVDARLGGARQRLARVGLCAVLGLAGGAAGGLAGQWLHSHRVPLFVGWVLAGGLIGASIGAYDMLRAAAAGQGLRGAGRKMLHGTAGGFLGGLVGGLPYTFLIGSPALPRGGPAASLVMLGSCIGLMIGLAQVMLKEAWLKVEVGLRPGRELLLTKDETTIGRSEACDLGLFGDAAIDRLHARVLRRDGRFVLSSVAGAGETLVNDRPTDGKAVPLRSGDRIRVGKSVVVFGERNKRE